MLGIVVVAHNSASVLAECLESCGEFANAPVAVVDNASNDDSVRVAKAAGVIVIANPENRGFAGAVNQGVRQLGTDLILLLNPDAELLSPVNALVAACLQPEVGACAGALVDSKTHQPQKGFAVRRFPSAATLIFETLGLNRVFPWNPINRRYRCADLDLSTSKDIEQPAAAFLLFRRDAWESVGGFDESFHPIWFEDVDFCKRLIDRGWTIRYVPEAIASHEGGHSAGKLASYKKRSYWYVSLLRYARKHYSELAFRCVCIAVLVRTLLQPSNRSREFDTEDKVINPSRFSVRGLITGKT